MTKIFRRPTQRDFEALECPPPEPRRYWTAPRITQMTLLFGIAAAIELFALWLLYNPEFLKRTIHPALIPWINTQAHCEATGRDWDGQSCLDYEHNRQF